MKDGCSFPAVRNYLTKAKWTAETEGLFCCSSSFSPWCAAENLSEGDLAVRLRFEMFEPLGRSGGSRGPVISPRHRDRGGNYINPKQRDAWQLLKGCGKRSEIEATLESQNLKMITYRISSWSRAAPPSFHLISLPFHLNFYSTEAMETFSFFLLFSELKCQYEHTYKCMSSFF